MRKGWTETTLGEVLNLLTDGSHFSPISVEDGMPYVTVRDVANGKINTTSCARISSDSFDELVKNGCAPEIGDVLFSKDGTVGRVALVVEGPKFVVLSSLAILRPNTKLVSSEFLALSLSSDEFQAAATGSKTGLAIKRVVLKVLRALEFKFPTLPEQRRIVDVVSSVDAYVDALQQQTDTARAARNAVLHKLLSTGGDDWTEATLGGVAVFYNGKAYKQDELLAAGKYRVLRVGNFFSNGSWYWSELELDANKYCDNGDLLYAWSASFGPRIWTDEKVIYHYHIWKVEENPLLVEKKFLCYWLEDDVQRMKRDAGTGSIMMHITKGEIEARAIALPPLVEQRRIVEIVSSMDEMIQSTEQAVLEAKNLRSGLLSDLLSGEHEIPESYDRFLKAA
jgi:type I restriction enzyme, S subunit